MKKYWLAALLALAAWPAAAAEEAVPTNPAALIDEALSTDKYLTPPPRQAKKNAVKKKTERYRRSSKEVKRILNERRRLCDPC